MVQLPLALAMSLGMGSTQNWCVSIIFSWNQKEGRELGKGVLASKNSTLLLPKTSSRPGFCASFGCSDSRGWPACCGPCRSPVSKCLEEAFSTSLNAEKPQSWPGIYWCRWVELWMFQDWTDFSKRTISPKRKGTWVYCGFSKASTFVSRFPQRRTFKTPWGWWFWSKEWQQLPPPPLGRWRFPCFFTFLYRMDFCEYWSFDIFGLDCIYIYI